MNQYPDWLRKAASKGGKATGASKRRGDSAYYKRISQKAAKARKAKAQNAKRSDASDAFAAAPGSGTGVKTQ